MKDALEMTLRSSEASYGVETILKGTKDVQGRGDDRRL